MSPAETYEVEFFDTETVEAPRLLARVTPLPDEALASWLLRFADPFGVSPEALLLGDGEADLAMHPEWWRKPDPLLPAALARSAGVPNDDVRALTFADWPDDGRDDALPERFSRQRLTVEQPARQSRRIGVCPECFAEDDIPYVRRTWTLGWLAACPIHGTVLVRACPEWGKKLRLPVLSSRDHFAPDRCPHCAFRLARASTRAAPEPVIRFQQSEVFAVDGEHECVVEDGPVEPVRHDGIDTVGAAMRVGALGPFVDPGETVHAPLARLAQRCGDGG